MNDLQHFGIPGMKWGVRKTRSQVGRISKGKRYIVDKDEFGGTISKTRVSKKDFDDFMEKQKKQKVDEAFAKAKKWSTVAKVTSTVVTTASILSLIDLMNPKLKNRVIGTLAWSFGKVVSNSPLR